MSTRLFLGEWMVVVLAALLRIGWRIKRTTGSHKVLERVGWADYGFAFHRFLAKEPLVWRRRSG